MLGCQKDGNPTYEANPLVRRIVSGGLAGRVIRINNEEAMESGFGHQPVTRLWVEQSSYSLLGQLATILQRLSISIEPSGNTR